MSRGRRRNGQPAEHANGDAGAAPAAENPAAGEPATVSAEEVANLQQAEAALEQTTRKRGRPRKPKVKDTLRAYSDAEKDEARQRLNDAHDLQLSIHGQLRNQAKAVTKGIAEVAKMTGEEKGAVRWGVENRKRDPKEIDAEHRARTRIARFFKIPIGTQIGLFDDGATVAAKIENADAAAIEATKQAGYAAGRAGFDLEHKHAEGSPAALAFEVEWRRGQRENLSNIGNGSPPQPTHPEPAHA